MYKSSSGNAILFSIPPPGWLLLPPPIPYTSKFYDDQTDFAFLILVFGQVLRNLIFSLNIQMQIMCRSFLWLSYINDDHVQGADDDDAVK